MCWADEMVAGFALAKTIVDHPDGDLAIDSLVPEATKRCAAHLDELSAMGSDDRRTSLASSARSLRKAFSGDKAESMPPRARMWLAAEASRALGKRWLEDAPRARRGFRPNDRLLEVLRAVARDPEHGKSALAEIELRALREAGCLE